MSNNGNWNYTLLINTLPCDMVERIQAIEPTTLDTIDYEKCIWEGINSGYFTISKAFDLIADTSNPNHMDHWGLIWKLPILERISSCIWMIHYNGIMTNRISSTQVNGALL
ncbi:unnamed protein product [Lathyrus oleraceus]